jgi:hypothetical protein
MPKSGASQIHTHLQTSITINTYYGFMNKYINNIFNKYPNYLDDYILIHSSLGLSFNLNNTFIIFNIVI